VREVAFEVDGGGFLAAGAPDAPGRPRTAPENFIGGRDPPEEPESAHDQAGPNVRVTPAGRVAN
jgi:hypothetical protein